MTIMKNKELEIRQLALGTLGVEDMKFAGHELDEQRAREVGERISNGEFTIDEFCMALEQVMLERHVTTGHTNAEINAAREFYGH